jgi:hypothetical protein
MPPPAAPDCPDSNNVTIVCNQPTCSYVGQQLTVAGTCSIPNGPLAGTPVYMYDAQGNSVTTIT